MVDVKDSKGGTLQFEKRFTDTSWINNLIKINKSRLMNLPIGTGKVADKRYHPYHQHSLQTAGRQQKPLPKTISIATTMPSNSNPSSVTNTTNSSTPTSNSLMHIMIGNNSSRGQFVCSNCNTDFTNRDSLAMHMMESVRNQTCSGPPAVLNVQQTQQPQQPVQVNNIGGITFPLRNESKLPLKDNHILKQFPSIYPIGQDDNFIGRFQAMQLMKQMMQNLESVNSLNVNKLENEQQLFFLSQLWQIAMNDSTGINNNNSTNTTNSNYGLHNDNKITFPLNDKISQDGREKDRKSLRKRSHSTSDLNTDGCVVERPELSKSVPTQILISEINVKDTPKQMRRVESDFKVPDKRIKTTQSVTSNNSTLVKNRILNQAEKAINNEIIRGPTTTTITNDETEKFIKKPRHLQSHDDESFLAKNRLSSSQNINSVQNKQMNNSVHVYNFHCKQCGIGFKDQTLYSLHMGLHTVNNPWQCNICGETFDGKHDFASHALHF